jgi:hypothetical protein
LSVIDLCSMQMGSEISPSTNRATDKFSVNDDLHSPSSIKSQVDK